MLCNKYVSFQNRGVIQRIRVTSKDVAVAAAWFFTACLNLDAKQAFSENSKAPAKYYAKNKFSMNCFIAHKTQPMDKAEKLSII
jgi:hypothetical protein